jgi:hypothetical protein
VSVAAYALPRRDFTRGGINTAQASPPALLCLRRIIVDIASSTSPWVGRSNPDSDENLPCGLSLPVLAAVMHLLTLIQEGERYARELYSALDVKLREEDARRGVKARAKFASVR